MRSLANLLGKICVTVLLLTASSSLAEASCARGGYCFSSENVLARRNPFQSYKKCLPVCKFYEREYLYFNYGQGRCNKVCEEACENKNGKKSSLCHGPGSYDYIFRYDCPNGGPADMSRYSYFPSSLKAVQDSCSKKKYCDRIRKNKNSWSSEKEFCFDTLTHTLVRDSSGFSKYPSWKKNTELDGRNRRLYSLSTRRMTKRQLPDELLLRRLEDWENDDYFYDDVF